MKPDPPMLQGNDLNILIVCLSWAYRHELIVIGLSGGLISGGENRPPDASCHYSCLGKPGRSKAQISLRNCSELHRHPPAAGFIFYLRVELKIEKPRKAAFGRSDKVN